MHQSGRARLAPAGLGNLAVTRGVLRLAQPILDPRLLGVLPAQPQCPSVILLDIEKAAPLADCLYRHASVVSHGLGGLAMDSTGQIVEDHQRRAAATASDATTYQPGD
jgi:hypothetical protein